jgi:hypothetical protein
MSKAIEDAFRGAAGSIEHLVRTIVREELRNHLGPEADHLINVKSGPMSARKLRQLVRSGDLRGYKHGKDTFISASEFGAFIERRPVPPPARITTPDPAADPDQDGVDDVFVTLGYVPTDPAERRAFDARLARRRAEGGEGAATLRHAEAERVRLDEKHERDEERRLRRAEKKRRGAP